VVRPFVVERVGLGGRPRVERVGLGDRGGDLARDRVDIGVLEVGRDLRELPSESSVRRSSISSCWSGIGRSWLFKKVLPSLVKVTLLPLSLVTVTAPKAAMRLGKPSCRPSGFFPLHVMHD